MKVTNDATQVIHGDAGRPVELSGPSAGRAEAVMENAVRTEDLNAIVAPISNDDITVFVTSHAPRTAQFALRFPLFAESEQWLANC